MRYFTYRFNSCSFRYWKERLLGKATRSDAGETTLMTHIGASSFWTDTLQLRVPSATNSSFVDCRFTPTSATILTAEKLKHKLSALIGVGLYHHFHRICDALIATSVSALFGFLHSSVGSSGWLYNFLIINLKVDNHVVYLEIDMSIHKVGYNPKAIGERSEGQVIARLLKLGKTVLLPFGDNQRYDCVIEELGSFVRLQCKTGRIQDGSLRFDACSSSVHRGGIHRSYHGEIDFFVVYCPENDMCYKVPIGMAGTRTCSLRIDAPKNRQKKGIHWAKDFVL